MKNPHYDYIIAGAGCAGLSLAYYLSQTSLKNKHILLLDSELKNKDDRTWCFWEKETSQFEEIVSYKWDNILISTPDFSQKMSILPYQYKMIKGIDFYHFILQKLAQFPNITFLQRKITALNSLPKGAEAITENETFTADLVFNSCFRPHINPNQYIHLYQHFKGWVIETETDVFDTECPTLMDFDIPQHDETRFMYVMPMTTRIALVEATIFSPHLLKANEYEKMIEDYIEKKLSISFCKIIHQESGAIPMTNFPFSHQLGNHIYSIGTAGGNVKSSTGYAFQNIQKQMQHLAKCLEMGITDTKQFKLRNQKRFKLYDSILLNILLKKPFSTYLIFKNLFQKNPPQRIFRFLDEQSHFTEDLKIMACLPKLPFLKSLTDIILTH